MVRFRTALWAGIFLVGLAPWLGACQRRCQPAETQSFKSLIETPWRLVQSTDPSVPVDNYNFLIVTFNRNFTGEIKRVVDNDQYDTPVQTLVWSPNVTSRTVRIQYTSSSGTTGDNGTVDYRYTLGRQLEMVDNSGHYYRYVPFRAVVDPDTVCTF